MRARDGRVLAAHWFDAIDRRSENAASRRGAVVINGATGFPQTFYFKLAHYLSERGYDTLVYDYRGMGQSALGGMGQSARGDLSAETALMSDWGRFDMPAALDAIADRAQGRPVITLGHSIGGQFLGLLPNHARACAHVQIATSVGYWRWEGAPFKYLAWWFWRVHGPVLLAIKGYVPTGGGWSGLPLPRGVYEEWRRWCLRPAHFGPDLATYLSGNFFGEIRAPVLTVGFTDDPIATRRTVAEINKFFPNVQRESRWYSPTDAGVKHIGHEGFFSVKHRDTLWQPVVDWIDSRVEAAA
ncbi:MAG TPA: alpha/beta fold hydrolase [Steroidobacteraceae bacterium]|nr:alpha/beta fold hydrolase [Steroidobacteraceae bacterium]